MENVELYVVGDRQQENNFSVRIKRYTFGDILFGTGNRKTASDVVETDARIAEDLQNLLHLTPTRRAISICQKSNVESRALFR